MWNQTRFLFIFWFLISYIILCVAVVWITNVIHFIFVYNSTKFGIEMKFYQHCNWITMTNFQCLMASMFFLLSSEFYLFCYWEAKNKETETKPLSQRIDLRASYHSPENVLNILENLCFMTCKINFSHFKFVSIECTRTFLFSHVSIHMHSLLYMHIYRTSFHNFSMWVE